MFKITWMPISKRVVFRSFGESIYNYENQDIPYFTRL